MLTPKILQIMDVKWWPKTFKNFDDPIQSIFKSQRSIGGNLFIKIVSPKVWWPTLRIFMTPCKEFLEKCGHRSLKFRYFHHLWWPPKTFKTFDDPMQGFFELKQPFVSKMLNIFNKSSNKRPLCCKFIEINVDPV